MYQARADCRAPGGRGCKQRSYSFQAAALFSSLHYKFEIALNGGQARVESLLKGLERYASAEGA
jgi:hypothetical protein